ncbi:MAG: tyrosine-type recombinase/integrase [Thermoplasmatales archaeon]
MQDVSRVIENYLARVTATEATVANYRVALSQFADWFRVAVQEEFRAENVTRMEVVDYVHYLSNHLSMASATIRARVAIVAGWVYRETGRRLGPISVPKDRDRASRATYRDMRNELVANAERARSLRDVALVRLLATTGLRLSRIVSLRVIDIDTKGRRILVFPCAPVPLTQKTAHVVQRYIESEGLRPDDYLFPGASGRRDRHHISDRAARYIVARYGACSPEDLRRAMAEDLRGGGVAAHVVDLLMGRRASVPAVDMSALARAAELADQRS